MRTLFFFFTIRKRMRTGDRSEPKNNLQFSMNKVGIGVMVNNFEMIFVLKTYLKVRNLCFGFFGSGM